MLMSLESGWQTCPPKKKMLIVDDQNDGSHCLEHSIQTLIYLMINIIIIIISR